MPTRSRNPLQQATRLRVLLVEDNAADAELLIACAGESGYDLTWTRVEDEPAYRAALASAPDIVLSDFHLPRFDGMRALAILREQEGTPDIPFILVSGAVSEQQAIEAMRRGADDFLLKDRLGRLGAAIAGAIERRRLLQRARQHEERLQAFFENTSAVTFIKDTGGRYLHVNRRFLQAFGLDEAAVIGSTDDELFEAAQAAAFRDNDRRVLASGAALTFEEKARFTDGCHTSLVVRFPVHDADGRIYAIGGIATDITERKVDELRHRATFELAPVGIVHTALDGRFIEVNPKACEIFGHSRAELLGRNFLDITHPADHEASAAFRRRLIAGEHSDGSTREKRYVRKDHSVAWAAVSVSLVRKPGGEPDYFLTMIQDVTARRNAEESLRATFDQPAVGIALTLPTGEYLDVNDRLCEMLGYPREDLLGKNAITDITHPDDRKSGRQRAAKMLRGEIQRVHAEQRYLRKDGSIIHVTRSMSLARGPDGEPRYIVSMITDVTDRKTAEDLFAASFEQAGVGMSLRRPGMRTAPWIRVNQKLCDMLGYTRDEMMRLSTADVTLPEDQHEAYGYNERILKGEISGYSRERRYRRKDGAIIWCHVSIASVRDADGRPSHVLAVIQDITGRKQAEARLEQTFEQAAVGIVRVDFDSKILEANQKFCDMTGYDREAVLRMNLKQISHPDDLGLDTALRGRLISGEIDHFSSEKRYRRKDGQLIWARRTTSLARDISDHNPHFILVVEDITERKTAEEQHRATFDNAPVGIMHSTLDRRILRVNPKLCEILGYTQEELLALSTAELLPPEYRAIDRPLYLQRMLKGEIQSFASQRPFIRKDGSLVWTNRTVSLVRDGTGQPLYFLRIIEDISERKRAEDALTQERLLLRSVLDALPERIYVKDAEGRFMLQNAVNLRVRGLERHEDIIGKTVFDIFPQQVARRLHDEDMAIIRSGEAVIDREAQTRFGMAENGHKSTRWHLTSKVPLKNAAGQVYGLVGVNRDITERKLAEASILRLNRFYSTLSATNAAIVRARDSDALFRAICRIAVSEGGLGCAWIRIHDRATGELRIVAHAGVSKHYLANLTVSTDAARPEGRGLAGRSFRENRVMVSNDMLNDPTLERWHQRASEYGFRSLASVPFSCNGEVIGVLGLQARETDFFDPELVRLLEEMAGDISFALTGMNLQEQHQATLRALRESDEQFRQLASHIPQVFWITDAAQRDAIYVSPTYETVTGRPVQELEANPRAWLDAVHEDDRQRVQYARREKAPLGSYDIEYRMMHGDGTVRWIHDRAFPVKNLHGEVYRIAGITEDITESKRAREQLAHLAHYDSLTGLPNRVLFNDRLRQSVAQARRNHWILGVMFLDLDRFKLVNDTLGHATGDLLLQQVATRLTGCLRPTDTVARVSGDEFAVILSELAEAQNAGYVAQKVLSTLAAPFELDGNEVFVTASIGITLFPSDSSSIETLVRDADAAMYSAKDAGRNNYQYYTAAMNASTTEKLQFETRLRRALARDEFVLHYQPKIDIPSGRISGLEALLRWQAPGDGLVPPDRFIPLLEETGLIVPVGEWVARKACAQLQAWREAGITPVPVAINLSAHQLRQQGFSAALDLALRESGVEPELIQVEITESSLMENPEEAIIVLQKLRDLGISLAADDFGTGYSSLNYLKRFPLDALKIDRSFIRDITIDADDAVIARTVITLAHSLGLKVVAEGVETEEQLAFLGENRCDEAQGYLFSKPLPADACATMLAAGQPLHRSSLRTGDCMPAVLVVDDDDDHLELTRLLLQKDGHSVFVAANTHDAFELLATHRISIVVSDQSMPEMSGVEFLRRIKLMYPEIVRIMLSGVGDFGTATAAINEGEVHKFYVKARDEELLRREIKTKLRGAPTGGPS